MNKIFHQRLLQVLGGKLEAELLDGKITDYAIELLDAYNLSVHKLVKAGETLKFIPYEPENVTQVLEVLNDNASI